MYARGAGDRPPPGTLNQLFFNAARKWNKLDAMQVRVDGRWQPISHATVLERVAAPHADCIESQRNAANPLQDRGM